MRKVLLFLSCLAVLALGGCNHGDKDADQVYGILLTRSGTVEGNSADCTFFENLFASVTDNWKNRHDLYWEVSGSASEEDAKSRELYRQAYEDFREVIRTVNEDQAGGGSSLYTRVDIDLTWNIVLYKDKPANVLESRDPVRFRLVIQNGTTIEGPVAE